VWLSLVPTVVKAAIAATEIKDAIRPYSIAVAPLSSSMKPENTPIFHPRRASLGQEALLAIAVLASTLSI
jgi:hypothetical protein